MKSKPYKPSALRGIFFLILTLIFLPYLAWSRPWSEILLYSLVCSFPLALRLASREVRIYYEMEDRPLQILLMAKLLIPTLFFVAVWIVPLLPAVATLYGIVAFAIDLLGWLANTLTERNVSVAVGVIGTGVVGVMLFYFRLKLRCLYGCSEVLVGLLVAGARLNDETNPSIDAPVLIALLTAGAYLVVRGLDNVHQGLKSQDDPFVSYLIRTKDALAKRDRPKRQ